MEVTELLGYIYEQKNSCPWRSQGRLLGFPTANVKVKSTVRLHQELASMLCKSKSVANGMLAWAQLVIMTPLEKAAVNRGSLYFGLPSRHLW